MSTWIASPPERVGQLLAQIRPAAHGAVDGDRLKKLAVDHQKQERADVEVLDRQLRQVGAPAGGDASEKEAG